MLCRLPFFCQQYLVAMLQGLLGYCRTSVGSSPLWNCKDQTYLIFTIQNELTHSLFLSSALLRLLPPSVGRMMEQSLQGDVMKTIDLSDVIVSISKNPRGFKLAWDFLRANWNAMIKKSVIEMTHLLHAHLHFD